MRRATTDDFARVAACVVRAMPDSIAERKADLKALLAVLPRDCAAREEVALHLGMIVDQERHQVKMLDLLSAAKGRDGE